VALIEPLPDEVTDPNGTFAKLQQQLIQGAAAIEELRTLKPVLARAISQLPKRQFKLSLSDQGNLDEWALQAKREEKSGAIVFRAVKA
jgi:hypothetical protein